MSGEEEGSSGDMCGSSFVGLVLGSVVGGSHGYRRSPSSRFKLERWFLGRTSPVLFSRAILVEVCCDLVLLMGLLSCRELASALSVSVLVIVATHRFESMILDREGCGFEESVGQRSCTFLAGIWAA